MLLTQLCFLYDYFYSKYTVMRQQKQNDNQKKKLCDTVW